MRTPIIDGRSIEQFIPADLRGMFYQHPMPEYKYAIHNGYDPYGFSTKGLVLYLPLWALKGSSFKSVDAYKHTCDVTGALWRPDGRLFDGNDDKITIPRHSSLEPAKLTLNCWAYIKSGASEATGGLFDKAYTSHIDPYYSYTFQIIDANTGTPNLFFAAVVGAYDVDNITIVDISSIVNTWAMLTATFDEDYLRAYINGNEEGSLQNTGSLTYYDTDLNIGQLRNLGPTNFYGLLGDMWIYNRALTSLEIQHIYLATKWRYQ